MGQVPKGHNSEIRLGRREWEKVPSEKGGAIFSPDGNEMWTGRAWIPSPPGEIDSLNDVTKAKKKTSSTSFSLLFRQPQQRTIRHHFIEGAISLVTLIFTFLMVTSIFSSQIIQPLLFDASMVRTGRYALTMDAWDTIEEDGAVSVVGIGSSMLQYAINGTCIEEEMGSSNTFVYNLAIPGSMPYMEMIQTEAASQSVTRFSTARSRPEQPMGCRRILQPGASGLF